MTLPELDVAVQGRISRNHCVLTWNGNELSVRDVSANGIRIRTEGAAGLCGDRVSPYSLRYDRRRAAGRNVQVAPCEA